MSRLTWTSMAKSHSGYVRAENEDALLNAPNVGLWCVADGMGGHHKGDVASALIVESLASLTTQTDTVSAETITQAIQSANTKILDLANKFGEKVGSTVAALFIEDNTANVLWAGDSRVYHFSENTLTRITQDHNQAEELVMLGFLAPEQAESHPGSRLLTRAVGTRDMLCLDHKSLPCKASDIFIVCTDGLNGAMDDKTIEALLQTAGETDLSNLLINKALANQARDNVTVVAVQLSNHEA